MSESNTQVSVLQKTSYNILFSIAIGHFFNDLLQSTLLAVYPLLKEKYALSFVEIGLITLVFQATASMLQPVVGYQTDKKPRPYSLLLGMCFTLTGMLVLSIAPNFGLIILSAGCIGIGSSIFHPEASRVAYLSSGGKRSFAQSIFQLGGNAGTAVGPLLVALLVIPNKQQYIAWFALLAVVGILILSRVARWYGNHLKSRNTNKKVTDEHPTLSKKQINRSIAILLILIFSKYFYTVSLTNYYTFYLIDKFKLSIGQSQYFLFAFLGSVALGTLLGGYFGDKVGRKYIIWFSILGAAPFALLLPHANLLWTGILSVIIGLLLSSAFPAILVYAQELLPGKIGMISGLFYGFAFGMAGLGSAVLGLVADKMSIEFVYSIVPYFPLVGLIAYFLPNLNKKKP